MRALALLLLASGALAACGPDAPASGDSGDRTGTQLGYDKPTAPASGEAPAAAPEAEYLARVVATGSDGYLTLRDAPETRGRVTEMPHRLSVRVLGCREETIELEGAAGAWCRVRVPAREGWLFDAYLASGGAATHTVDANDFLALRTEPAVDRGRQTLRLLPGTPVTVTECLAMSTVGEKVGRWCRAGVGEMEGWAFGGFLERVGA